jgi:hypothetical protein
MSTFRSLGFIPINQDPDADADKKSDKMLKSGARNRFGNSERGKTIGSGGFKSSLKPSVVERFREKTMEMRLKKQDDSSIFNVA